MQSAKCKVQKFGALHLGPGHSLLDIGHSKARGEAARIEQESTAYKDRIIARAEGEAARFGKLLGEYEKAPAVTRERLYLEAVESVLGSTSKVMLDAEGGNNLMYIPLDKFLQERARTGTAIGAEHSAGTSRAPSGNMLNDSRQRRSTRLREGR